MGPRGREKQILTSQFAVEFICKIEERCYGNSYAMFQIREAVGRSQMLFKMGVFKNFANFARKILCLSPFLIKLQGCKGLQLY